MAGTIPSSRRSLTDEVEHVEVSVRDTGPGISPKVLRNLFIPFFTTKTQGTGLGLAISQSIVRNAGGMIEVQSQPGAGTTFTIVLPSAGESFGMVAAEAAAAGTPVVVTDRCGVADFFRRGEALVIPGQQAAILDALRSVLADPKLRARMAAGGVEAARRQSWDVVTDRQEELYRLAVASRTAASRLSTDGP